MIRTQIQLREDQSERLQRLAKEEGCSVAELIRRSVDGLLSGRVMSAVRVSRTAALGVIGLGGSGAADVSSRHDEYLGEAYLGESPDDGRDTRGGDCGVAPDAGAVPASDFLPGRESRRG